MLYNILRGSQRQVQKKFGQDKDNSLPDLVYLATVFHGNEKLLARAIEAGQVEEYMVKGQRWLRNASKEIVKESGNNWSENISQTGEVDQEKAKALVDAVTAMCWELPALNNGGAQRAIQSGSVPEEAYGPLEDVIQVAYTI